MEEIRRQEEEIKRLEQLKEQEIKRYEQIMQQEADLSICKHLKTNAQILFYLITIYYSS